MLLSAIRKLPGLPLLVGLPVAIDGLSALTGILMNGFHGSPHLAFKLALQMGLPSVSAVTEQRFMAGTVQMNADGGLSAGSAAAAVLVLLAFLLVQAFFQGGYIGLLRQAANERSISLRVFYAYGMRFFGRFLLLNLLVLALLLVGGGLAVYVLHGFGAVVSLLAFLILRVWFVYLEFTLVSENCSILQAFPRALRAFGDRTGATTSLIVKAVMLNILFGLLINAVWISFFFFLLLFLYDYIFAGLQLAFMEEYERIEKR
ncbi:hypothetical protein [Paenibacillus sacheonensis]|uniref:DUF975 family protein n=1 Tax=Paenibacillus sacheonensis TaxID=742054 RepID=A0A7X4YRX7_9BACL|nr:hypothetical protein [Paenibacillus sacheonensis]MBM7566830.1 hypothetical protein [Paenibacillus sacheonensis]NBC71452.1 hypothetical protein [Paenibacillus sacheonensis]